MHRECLHAVACGQQDVDQLTLQRCQVPAKGDRTRGTGGPPAQGRRRPRPGPPGCARPTPSARSASEPVPGVGRPLLVPGVGEDHPEVQLRQPAVGRLEQRQPPPARLVRGRRLLRRWRRHLAGPHELDPGLLLGPERLVAERRAGQGQRVVAVPLSHPAFERSPSRPEVQHLDRGGIGPGGRGGQRPVELDLGDQRPPGRETRRRRAIDQSSPWTAAASLWSRPYASTHDHDARAGMGRCSSWVRARPAWISRYS